MFLNKLLLFRLCFVLNFVAFLKINIFGMSESLLWATINHFPFQSCIIKRYCEKRFVPKYLATIGIDYGVTK